MICNLVRTFFGGGPLPGISRGTLALGKIDSYARMYQGKGMLGLTSAKFGQFWLVKKTPT